MSRSQCLVVMSAKLRSRNSPQPPLAPAPGCAPCSAPAQPRLRQRHARLWVREDSIVDLLRKQADATQSGGRRCAQQPPARAAGRPAPAVSRAELESDGGRQVRGPRAFDRPGIPRSGGRCASFRPAGRVVARAAQRATSSARGRREKAVNRSTYRRKERLVGGPPHGERVRHAADETHRLGRRLQDCRTVRSKCSNVRLPPSA